MVAAHGSDFLLQLLQLGVVVGGEQRWRGDGQRDQRGGKGGLDETWRGRLQRGESGRNRALRRIQEGKGTSALRLAARRAARQHDSGRRTQAVHGVSEAVSMADRIQQG